VRTAEELIGAYRQLISRAHARGVKLIGATLTPCEGVDIPGYESKEATRQTVNKWIRTSGAFDGLIDFDAVLRDPDHPSRLSPRFASEDHLHPNAAGYQAMAGVMHPKTSSASIIWNWLSRNLGDWMTIMVSAYHDG